MGIAEGTVLMHTLKVLVFINKTKSFEVFLLEKYVCAKPKSKTKKNP
jgi:hypothetical protein